MSDEPQPTPPTVTEPAAPAPEPTFADYVKSRETPPAAPDPPAAPVSEPAKSEPEPAPVAEPAPAPAEPAAPAPKPEEPVESDDPTKPPYQGEALTPTQKRINKAWRKQKDAERAAAAADLRERQAREENARLRGELDAYKTTGKPAPAQTPAATAAAALPDDDPSDPKPKVESFPSYEDGIEALSAWRARREYRTLRAQERAEDEKRRAEDSQRTAQQQWQTDFDTYNQRVADFRADHDDWETVVNRDQMVITPDVMAPFIIQSPIGPALTYYLGQHPDECRALAALPPGPQAFAALGKLEAKVEALASPPATSPASVTAATPPPPKTSAAPPPVTPVRSVPTAAPPGDVNEFREYARRRDAGLKVR